MWIRIGKIAAAIGDVFRKPHVVVSQLYPALSCKCREFIDHVLEELKTRFDDTHKGLLTAQSLVPIYLDGMTIEKIKDLVEYYGNVLIFIERDNLEAEVLCWKQQFTGILENEKTKTANQALTKCTARVYPAISKILTIFLTVPVGSVPCKSSFSGLRRL